MVGCILFCAFIMLVSTLTAQKIQRIPYYSGKHSEQDVLGAVLQKGLFFALTTFNQAVSNQCESQSRPCICSESFKALKGRCEGPEKN
ncbi:hypothetical protein Plhal304r1_c005g0019241 [Plasmopara halstedii]